MQINNVVLQNNKRFIRARESRFTALSLLLCCFLFGYVGSASADEIILQNGDRLSGTITKMADGILILATQYSEPIKIKKEKIMRIFMRHEAVIQMSGGEVLKGKIDTDENGGLFVEAAADRGKTTIPWGAVSAINPAPPSAPAWKGSISLGMNSQTGNTSRTNVNFGAEAARRGAEDRISMRLQYAYAREKGTLTARNTFGALKYDYFFSKSVFGYLGLELLSDKFKDISLRTTIGPGVGYQIWEDPVRSLSVEAGLSYAAVDYRKARDERYLSARFGGDITYKVLDTVVLSDKVVVYPSLKNVGRYKLRNEAGISSAIGKGWALKFANILDHDSHPPADIGKSDISWTAGLQYSF